MTSLSRAKTRRAAVLSPERVDGGRERLLAEALVAFARDGFDGASTRAIALSAGVNHSLIAYHFGNKDGLWRAAMSTVLALFQTAQTRRAEGREGLGAADVLRLTIRDFVSFCAERPEFHRVLTAEWAQGAPRIRWLGETYIRPLSAHMIGLIVAGQRDGCVAAGEPVRILYAIIGVAATAFAMAPEYQMLTGQDPRSAAGISQTVSFIERMVFAGHSAAAIVSQ